MLKTTNATHNVVIKNTLHTNSYNLIQSCDWFTALLAPAVKSVKCKLHHNNRHHQNTPGVLPARRTYHGVETAKDEDEMARPQFCIQSGLIVSAGA